MAPLLSRISLRRPPKASPTAIESMMTIRVATGVALFLLCLLLDASAAASFFHGSGTPPRDDPYKVLGVKRTATSDDIQRAYRQRARETHPDKNPSPRANEEFQRVTDAFEILGDPARRRRHDSKARQPREREARRNKTRRKQDERARRERAEMAKRARASQVRMIRISNLQQFEWAMLDPSGKVYETHCLIMFVSNKKAERSGNEELYFPYPFADDEMIRTAKVRFNSQTDLTRLFRAKSRSNSPHVIFARKGNAVGDFQIFRPQQPAGPDAHSAFRQWVDSFLVIEATIGNRHLLPVEVKVMRDGRVIFSHDSLSAGYELILSLRTGDRILAFDKRVDRFPGAARAEERMARNPGVLLLDEVAVSYKDTYMVKNIRCYDLSTRCHDWTSTSQRKRNQQCKVNPEFMHHVCPFTCGVCSERITSGISYVAFHLPLHRFPEFLRVVVHPWRHFVDDTRSILRFHKNAAGAFFAAGVLVVINVALFKAIASLGPRTGKSGVRLPSRPVMVLDMALLLLATSVCAGVGWMVSTAPSWAPPWLQGFHGDLVGVAGDFAALAVLLGSGVLASAYFIALLGRIRGGDMNGAEAAFFCATLLALAGGVITVVLFMMSLDATQALRWERLWRYRKNACLTVFVVGAFAGVGLASLKRLAAPLQKTLAIPGIALNMMIVLAANAFASMDPHFQIDLMQVLELRKNAAFAFVILGVLAANFVLCKI